MKDPVYVDGILVDWGDSFFNRQIPTTKQGQSRGKYASLVPKQKKARAPAIKPMSGDGKSKSAASFGTKITSGDNVRARLKSITRKAPEVLVKISGIGHGMNKVNDHLDYISRNGQIELEDEKGDVWREKDEVAGVRDAWQYGGQNRLEDEEGSQRLTYNIVLSMPAGTPPLAVKRAVRDFAARQFDGHRYVMALHTEETDPDPKPSPNPHVHLCVVAEGEDGARLNPRKADLQEWREGFAAALREHGIEAAATNRQQRLQRERGERQAVLHMRDRGERLTAVGRPAPASAVEMARRTKRSIEDRYRDVAKALAASADPDDRKLAKDIAHWTADRSRPGANRYTPDYNNLDHKRISHARHHAAALVRQPDTGSLGARRPASTIAGVRDLSSLTLVQGRRLPEMLLPSHARDDLGARDREPDHDVRRSGAGIGRDHGGPAGRSGEVKDRS